MSTPKRPRRKPGRPTKLTADTVRRMVDALTLGSDYEIACGYAGISYQTHRNWFNAGEEEAARREAGRKPRPDEQPYLEYFEAVKGAEATAAVSWLAAIEASTDWQSKAWKLERRFPEKYGRRVVDNRLSGAVNVTEMSDAELLAFIEGAGDR